MATRLFEGKDHAADYFKYRMAPNLAVSNIIGLVKQKTTLPAPLAVDVGCGSGQGTVLLAPYFNQVVGTDVSPAQLENALVNHQFANVSYKESLAEDLPFESGTVDLLTAMTAAHWFDWPRFQAEVDRVLKPGGCMALLTYAMDMVLEYGDSSEKLKEICLECYDALRPFKNQRLLPSSSSKYKEMFNSCPYPEKQWHEGLEDRKVITVNGYISLVQTFSAFQTYLEHDSKLAEDFCSRTRKKLLDAMGVSSPDTEVTLVTKYFYWIAWKPTF